MGEESGAVITPTGARRRWLIGIAVVSALVVIAAVAWRQLDAAAAGGPPSTASQEQGMVSGQPYRDPADADTGDHPNLTITLDAQGTRFDLAGRKVWGQSYDGGFVAPTIHARPGGHVAVRLVNHLPVATNLHFHGLHVSPNGDADNSMRCVAPGQTLTYHLDLPANHPQGTYWYHSHAMGTSCPDPGKSQGAQGNDADQGMPDMPGMPHAPQSGSPQSSPPPSYVPGDVENQIFAGLSGALVIGDDRALLPPPLHDITAHTMVFKDAQIDESGHIVQNTDHSSIDSNKPTVRLLNGQLRPVLSMRPGETQLWRLTNAGADIFYRLQLDGYRFSVVGEDGVPVAQVSSADTLLLPPGKRYDVLVTAGPKAGPTTLRTLAYGNGPGGDNYPDTPLAAVAVGGPAAPPVPPVSGPIPTAPADLADARIAEHRTVDFTEDEANSAFFVNGRRFMMDDKSVFDTPAHLGTVEEWTIVNHTDEDHPFHLHTNHFQVMSVNGEPWPYTHVQDTIPVPHQDNGVPGRVVLRVAFTDYPGNWMFHCHIAAHEDNGMMSYVNVVG